MLNSYYYFSFLPQLKTQKVHLLLASAKFSSSPQKCCAPETTDGYASNAQWLG